MKNYYLFTACLIAVVFIGVKSSMLMIEAEKGKKAKIDFGEGMFLIKRVTKASPNPQYYFAHPKQDGTWTTDGKDKIPSTAHLHWNGTMIFSKIDDTDAGDYTMPLEPSRLPMAQSMISVNVFFMQKSPERNVGGKN